MIFLSLVSFVAPDATIESANPKGASSVYTERVDRSCVVTSFVVSTVPLLSGATHPGDTHHGSIDPTNPREPEEGSLVLSLSSRYDLSN